MWGLLKKAGEALAPILTTNAVDEFKAACGEVFNTMNDRDPAATTAFIGALNNVQDYLAEEVGENKVDIPCFDYFSGEAILQKIVDSIGEDFPESHVEPILNFFLAFVNTDLNNLFAQVSVHRPFGKLLSLLQKLYLKDPASTREFANNLWRMAKARPLMLEMMAHETDLPLVDFFCALALAPGDEGEFARKAIVAILNQGEGKLPVQFKEYAERTFFPVVAEFIVKTMENPVTIQFTGSLSKLLEWVDLLLMEATVFPCEKILEPLKGYGPQQQALSLAFLLAFFSAKVIIEKLRAYAFSSEFLVSVVQLLKSESVTDKQSALAFLKIAFMACTDFSVLLPPECKTQSDVLSILPIEWLVGCEGSSGMDAYESDAMARINFYGSSRPAGTNSELFSAVVSVLALFKTLPIPVCLCLTKVITQFVSIAPDLIGDELVGTFQKVVASFDEVKSLQLPTDDFPDTPESRAGILAEFAKELHTTFVAAEKLQSMKTMFAE